MSAATHSYAPRMQALARTFPTLEDAPLDPWNPNKLDQWGCSGVCSGAVHAVRFVLSVWNSHSSAHERVRRDLLHDLQSRIDGMVTKAYDLQDREKNDFSRRRIQNGLDATHAAFRAYRVGELDQALEQATAAAKFCNVFEPLGRAFKCGTLEHHEVLKRIHEAEVWDVGRFDVQDAFGTWDNEHRAAFVAWAQKPWWA